MRGLPSFLVGSTAEAWAEFRTHKARVLMSLIGVALAVLALTGVAGVGAIAQQAVTESLERNQGRPAMLRVSPPFDPSATGGRLYSGDFRALVAAEAKRYGIRFWSTSGYGSLSVATAAGVTQLQLQTVDPAYGAMFRQRLVEGAWFRETDATRLAPAVIIDSAYWKQLGSPPLASHPSLRIVAPSPVTAIIVGVTPGGYPDQPSGIMLYDAYLALVPPGSADMGGTTYQLWVPPRNAAGLSARIQSDLGKAVGDAFRVEVSRADYQAVAGPDPLLLLRGAVGGAAGLILLLATLGLLNIALVTVRTRIREIGIRRSFGATAGRVFFGVMMESVVATLAAGVVGVVLAILALKNPWVTDWLRQNARVQDVPGFPFEAALFGLAVAAGVGALAGLLPAIVAVRVKPIDAIRY